MKLFGFGIAVAASLARFGAACAIPDCQACPANSESPQGEVVDGERFCICEETGEEPVDGICPPRECPEFSRYDEEKRNCFCNKDDEIVGPENETCCITSKKCRQKEQYKEGVAAYVVANMECGCKCEVNKLNNNKCDGRGVDEESCTCKDCPSGSDWDKETKSCICENGEAPTEQGCGCPEGSIWSTEEESCICGNGEAPDDVGCIQEEGCGFVAGYESSEEGCVCKGPKKDFCDRGLHLPYYVLKSNYPDACTCDCAQRQDLKKKCKKTTELLDPNSGSSEEKYANSPKDDKGKYMFLKANRSKTKCGCKCDLNALEAWCEEEFGKKSYKLDKKRCSCKEKTE